LEGRIVTFGIIGIGAVGSAIAMAAAARAQLHDIMLVNRNRARARAVATDMHYGVALSPMVTIRDGDYADLADAGLAIITAGINEKTGGATDRSDPAGRFRLLEANVKVYQDIVPKLVKAAPQAVILVATDPPDPLVDVARQLAGHDRVMGTSTYLDSLRFRLHVGERLGVSSGSVEADVVGEHGTSSVFLWSSARIGGMPVRELLARRRIEFETFRKDASRTCASPISPSSRASAPASTALGCYRRASPKRSWATNVRSSLPAPTIRASAPRCRCPASSAARESSRSWIRKCPTKSDGH
jgi:L-lactate dehydrogenase